MINFRTNSADYPRYRLNSQQRNTEQKTVKSKTGQIGVGKKAVLFDIDGVLLDSFDAGLRLFQDMLASMGYPKPTRREFRKVFHLPLVPVLKHFTKSELTEELERIHELVEKIPYHSELLSEPEHAKETLMTLSKSYKLGIVTSRNKAGLSRRYFPFANTRKFFSAWVTVEDVTHHKPHPEPLLLAAKRLKLKPSECVYIGDSHTDIDAGKAAGMKTILYGGKKHADADAHVRSFEKLPEVVEKLASKK
ncbi:MAG: putative phosphatase [Parcubacteria group bacterium GW2011_GWA2_49_9]|nr:MAG: putative phosphatase [Parcubacteria group bacterium GW2011_GWA2_49_9]